MKIDLRALLLSSILLSSSLGWGWGMVGHRATGYIAEGWLTPAARQEVNRLLQGVRLADIASWADTLRTDSGMGHISWYHFEKMDDGVTYLNYLQQMPAPQRQKGGVIEAILVAQSMLENPSTPDADKAVALKLLVHFIGDLHQPLHTGRPEDKGGVTIPVTWFGQKVSLHKVWDSGMILSGHGDLFANLAVNADYALPYAQWLVKRYQGVTMPANTRWNTESWLVESLNARPAAYQPMTDQMQYQNNNLQTVDSRIYAAGLRIADVLNRIFAGQRSPVDIGLYNRIEQIVGRLENIISFRPSSAPGTGLPE